jgi:chitodextrinase
MRVKPPHASVGIIVLILLLGTTSSAFASAAKPHGSFRALTRLDRKAPTAPTSLKVTGVASTSITVAWKSSRDNFGVIGYAVYVNGVLKDRTGTTSDAVTGVDCGTSYVIAVAAYDLAGNNSQKASVIASTSPCVAAAPTPPPPPAGDTQAPSAPSGLTETAATGSQVSLSWNPATDNVGITGYSAYFGGNQAGSTTSTNYTFGGLTCGSTYSVGVDAVDAAGNHSTIASAIVATAACPDTLPPTAVANLLPSQITATTVALWWSPSLDNAGVTGYGVYRNGTSIGTTTATAYTVTGLTCGTSYQLGADAADAAGNRSAISTISVTTSACGDTTPPSAPSGLAVTSVSQTGLTFNWSASTDAVGVTGYTVYRNGTQAGQTAATSYGLSSLTCGTTYSLAVEARDGAGNISARPSVSASTSACPPPPPPPPPPPTASGASVYLAVSGNDSTCVRNDPTHPCATFNRAYHVAQGGDTVLVAAGSYPVTAPSEGATAIDPDGSKSSAVTFACQGNGDVTFAAPVFAFHPGLGGVTFTGSCFRFHVPYFGYGGYTALTHDVILDRVHMDSFECAGCANVTIMNSEVGPMDTCYGPGHGRASCDPANPVEAYWASRSAGSTDVQAEPYVHNGGAGFAKNFSLIGDHIHGMQTRDSGSLHTGGLLIWNVDGLILRGNLFDHNAIYDIEENANSTVSNVTMENNVFGWPVYPFDGASTDGQETPKDWREIDLGGAATLSNALIRYNSFAHGALFRADGTFSNVRVVGNILGNYSACGPAGITFDHNMSFGGGTACGGAQLTSVPYASYGGMDWHIGTGSTAALYVPGASDDERLASDIEGTPRSTPVDAGAYKAR